MGDFRFQSSTQKGAQKMKLTPILFVIITLTIAPIFAFTGDIVAEETPSADYRIWGVSRADNGTLALAIDDNAKIIFPNVVWSIWVAQPTPVKAIVTNASADNVIVDDVIPAGIHNFDVVAPIGAYNVTWTIGTATQTYNLTVASGTSSAVEYERPDHTIKVTQEYLSREEMNIAGGCILLALVPSLFIIPYHIRKKDYDYYDLF